MRAKATSPRHIDGVVSDAPCGRCTGSACSRREIRSRTRRWHPRANDWRGKPLGLAYPGHGRILRRRDGVGDAPRVGHDRVTVRVAADVGVKRHAARRHGRLVTRAPAPADQMPPAVWLKLAPHDPAAVRTQRAVVGHGRKIAHVSPGRARRGDDRQHRDHEGRHGSRTTPHVPSTSRGPRGCGHEATENNSQRTTDRNAEPRQDERSLPTPWARTPCAVIKCEGPGATGPLAVSTGSG